MLARTVVIHDGPLSIEETRHGQGLLVVALKGELDQAVVETARASLSAGIAGPSELVVIDLTALEFIDSSGIALFYRLAADRPDADTLCLLASHHAGVNRLLALTEVGSVLDIVGAERVV